MNGGTTLRRVLIRGALIPTALPVLAATLVLAGCGSSSSAGATSGASATSTAVASAGSPAEMPRPPG